VWGDHLSGSSPAFPALSGVVVCEVRALHAHGTPAVRRSRTGHRVLTRHTSQHPGTHHIHAHDTLYVTRLRCRLPTSGAHALSCQHARQHTIAAAHARGTDPLLSSPPRGPLLHHLRPLPRSRASVRLSLCELARPKDREQPARPTRKEAGIRLGAPAGSPAGSPAGGGRRERSVHPQRAARGAGTGTGGSRAALCGLRTVTLVEEPL